MTTRTPTNVAGSGTSANAPWALHREGVDGADSLPITDVRQGMNMNGYEEAILDVIPTTLANPDIVVLFWSEATGAFVREHVNLPFAGLGAGVAYQVRIPARGRVIFVAVTALAAETVDIRVAGARTLVQVPE